MPVFLECPVRRLSQEEFESLDYRVMGIIFDIHNDLGRHLREEVYEQELAYRLGEARIGCRSQFGIQLCFGDYSTDLFADLLIGEGAIYEIKVASALAPAHRAQAINYLLLTDTYRGKLINFGAFRVEGEFVSTSLTSLERRDVSVSEDQWRDTGPSSRAVKDVFMELVRDWGAFLQCSVYRCALLHFMGGEAKVHVPVNLYLGARAVGSQEVDLIDADTLLVITSFTKGLASARVHYQRLLDLTQKPHLQWINLKKSRIEFITLQRL